MNKTCRRAKNSRACRHAGLSLIELMVALTLGLFLVAGVLQVFLGSRQTANVVEAQSRMQESARFGFYFIGSMVRQAGYLNAGDITGNALFSQTLVSRFNNALRVLPGQSDGNPFASSPWLDDGIFSASAVVAGADNYGGSASSSVVVKADTDMFAVRMMGEEDPARPAIRDCEGVVIPRDDIVSMQFFVSDDDQLYCQVDDRRPVALLAGIEDMQIEYGLSSSTGTSHRYQVEQYRNASTLQGDEWPLVMAVRVGLLARSELQALSREPQSLYLLDNGSVHSFDDGRARQVFTQVIALRGNLSN